MSDEWEAAQPAVVASMTEHQRPRALRPGSRGATGPTTEVLPPHSVEAEQGVLGCTLLKPMECIPLVQKRLRHVEGHEFYDLRHREIWMTLQRMYADRLAGRPVCASDSAGEGIDLITVGQRLKDNQALEGVGGLVYVASLPDAVPSAANLDYYLGIVEEKYACRETIALCTSVAGRIYSFPGQIDHFIRQFQDDVAGLSRLSEPPEQADKMYLRPSALGDEFFQRWFGKTKGVHGLPLPELAFGDFPFLIRTRELTLVEAETKMGKSTMLSYITLHLLHHGMRGVIDSREVHYVDTMKKLVMQLIGSGEGKLCLKGGHEAKELGYILCQCASCTGAQKSWTDAMKWLEPRVLVNKTTGIKHWRDILDAFYELTKDGYNLFNLDSLMRIGIADDDFTQQAQCVTAFASFAIETDSVFFLVNHRNKGDGDYRQKSGGSYKVAANAHNICSIWKNQKKHEELAPYYDKLKAHSNYTFDDFREDARNILAKPDAKFYVHDQRLDGARSNAARELWFLKRAGQYFDHRHPRPYEPVNWLAKWTEAEKHQRTNSKQQP
jgi:hypothetical protein